MEPIWRELAEETMLGTLPPEMQEEAFQFTYDCAPLRIGLHNLSPDAIHMSIWTRQGAHFIVLFDFREMGDLGGFIDNLWHYRAPSNIIISHGFIMGTTGRTIIFAYTEDPRPPFLRMSYAVPICNQIVQALARIQAMRAVR